MIPGLVSYSVGERRGWQDHHRYRIVLQLQGDAAAVINHWREPYVQCGTFPALQVVLASFSAASEQVGIITRWMSRLLSTLDSFHLYLNNFSGIPPHLLYMRVQQNIGLHQLQDAIEKLNRYHLDYGMPALQMTEKPLLPLMESIPGMDYEKVLNFFARQECFLECEVQQVQLVREDIATGAWQLVQHFSLHQPPVGAPFEGGNNYLPA